ncbi:MAG: DUF4440 domain-containing protein [Gemmatimonadetes bacterium]|nr:DUF4440 domain-containing protein [Gemmatimonadota bacterium]
MITRRVMLPAMLAAALLSACQPQAPQPAGLTDQDRAAIDGIRQAYVQAIQNKDYASILALYTDDAMEMFSHEPMRQGKAAIEQALNAMPPVTAFTATAMATEGMGDLAYQVGMYSITVAADTMAAGGAAQPATSTGHYLVIVRKQADGTWKVTHAITNSDQPMQAPGMMAQPMQPPM